MDDLPALMSGEVPRHERRARLLRFAGAVGAGLLGTLLIVAAVTDIDGFLLGAVIWSGLGLAGLLGLTNLIAGWHLWQPYPDLGALRSQWVRAGATPYQLRILNEAHRLNALNPPVGYADRRTVINPLADAYAIFSSPAWRDPWLADRQLVIDPVVEAAEIIAYVHQVTAMLHEVGVRLVRSTPGSAAYRTYAGYHQALLASLDDGLKRAAALTAYRLQVGRLEVLLENHRALPEAEAFADRVMDVLSESARQELAATHLEESRHQLLLVEAGLREITALFTSPSARLGRVDRMPLDR